MYRLKIFLLFALSTIILSAQDFTDIKICLDPGHGGYESDDRHMIETDFWESESNLTKAFHLRYILESHNADIILTRDGNNGTTDDPSLSQRQAVANDNNVDYFLSIHSNGADGTVNYSMGIFNGETDDPTWPEAKEMSGYLADYIHNAARTTKAISIGDLTLNPGWSYGYGVLYGSEMPSNISEGSFHDYIPESWRLQNLDYRKKESWAIAQAFVEYWNLEKFDNRILAGLVRDKYSTVDYFALASLGDLKEPVNNVKVTLNPGGHVYHGDSMNNGFFMFDSLSPGDYQLIVEAEGFYNDTAEVTISDKMMNFQDFKLISKIPPIVEATTPEEGDSAFPAWEPIIIKFSRTMDTSSVNKNISFEPATTFETHWKENGQKLFIIPDSLKYRYDYTITFGAEIQDVNGHYLDGNKDSTGGDSFQLNFKTTPADIIPPEITASYPAMNANEIELNPVLNITYNEIITDTSVTEEKIRLEEFSTERFIPISLDHYIKNGKSGIGILPEEELKPDNLYIIRIARGITDTENNATKYKKSYSFRTGTTTWKTKKIDNFDNGLDNWWQPSASGSTHGVNPDKTIRTMEQDTTNLVTGSTISMKIDYVWDLNSDSWLLREYLAGGAPRNVTFNKERKLQAYVFGDGSNNMIRFALDDDLNGSGGHEVSPWYKIDWVGWKLVSWDMSTDETGEWIGDGSLDNKLRFDSIQLTHDSTDAEATQKGVVMVDDLRLVTEEPVNIETDLTQVPLEMELHQNYPNPFNPETTIEFSIPKATRIQLMIYNINGKLIRKYASNANAGTHQIIWDARNSQGLDVASGTYIYKLKAGNKVLGKKMILLR